MPIDLNAYDTDKPSGYLENYERELGHLFDRPVRLLELGVQRGGSLLLWRDLFPSGIIAGLDLNPVQVADDTGRIRVYQGFQQDGAVLDRIAAEVAPGGFDVIVDDASHVGEYTKVSFWHLFPRHLKPGGVYVIDDWGCGYWDHWPDGHAFEGNRATLGETSSEPVLQGGRAEVLRRSVRSAARPVAARLARYSPVVRRRLEDAYMKVEGAGLQQQFPSHDYGMVGFVKQLVDACSIDTIDRRLDRPRGLVESVQITPAQVFVRRSSRPSLESAPGSH